MANRTTLFQSVRHWAYLPLPTIFVIAPWLALKVIAFSWGLSISFPYHALIIAQSPFGCQVFFKKFFNGFHSLPEEDTQSLGFITCLLSFSVSLLYQIFLRLSRGFLIFFYFFDLSVSLSSLQIDYIKIFFICKVQISGENG